MNPAEWVLPTFTSGQEQIQFVKHSVWKAKIMDKVQEFANTNCDIAMSESFVSADMQLSLLVTTTLV
jgi:hypothetical protein